MSYGQADTVLACTVLKTRTFHPFSFQDATDPDSLNDALPAAWQSLQAQAETCAARAAAAPSAVVSAALTAATSATESLPLPPDAVLMCLRKLLAPGLGGGAARLLLAAVVLPAVEAVERVMPKPLLEALGAAGAGL